MTFARNRLMLLTSAMVTLSIVPGMAIGQIPAWTLTTAALDRQPVSLVGISEQGVSMGQPAGEPKLLPWNQVVSVERDVAAAVATDALTLHLGNGARLVGVPAALGESSLQWTEPSLGSMSIPLADIRSIDRGPSAEPAAAATSDRVQFTNGDSIIGVITDLSPDGVSLKTDTATNTVPLSSVRQLTLAAVKSPGKSSAPNGPHRVRLGLVDSSRLDVINVTTDGDRLTFTPVGAKKPVTIPLQAVVSIEQPDGPVRWLASLPPVQATSTPFFPFGKAQPARLDTDAGAPPHGITVFGKSAITFDIGPGFERLRASFRLEPTAADAPRWADPTVRVRLNDRVAFEKTNTRATDPAAALDLPLDGATRITLETDLGPTAGAQSTIDWLEPAVLRSPDKAPNPTTGR